MATVILQVFFAYFLSKKKVGAKLSPKESGKKKVRDCDYLYILFIAKFVTMPSSVTNKYAISFELP